MQQRAHTARPAPKPMQVSMVPGHGARRQDSVHGWSCMGLHGASRRPARAAPHRCPHCAAPPCCCSIPTPNIDPAPFFQLQPIRKDSSPLCTAPSGGHPATSQPIRALSSGCGRHVGVRGAMEGSAELGLVLLLFPYSCQHVSYPTSPWLLTLRAYHTLTLPCISTAARSPMGSAPFSLIRCAIRAPHSSPIAAGWLLLGNHSVCRNKPS